MHRTNKRSRSTVCVYFSTHTDIRVSSTKFSEYLSCRKGGCELHIVNHQIRTVSCFSVLTAVNLTTTASGKPVMAYYVRLHLTRHPLGYKGPGAWPALS